MVEMRWVWKTESDPLSSQYDKEIKVLQYRYKIPSVVGGCLTDISVWSEWIDVPTVEEGK